MLTAKLDARLTIAQLNLLLLRLRNKSGFFRTWGTAVEGKAKQDARAKGGRRIWRNIAGATRLHSVSDSGAVVQCYDPIGAHKETGGPIKAKNGRYLTIPIHRLAMGRTVGEIEARGIDLFRLPGTMTIGRGVGKGENQTYEPFFALCEKTRPQRADPWWPQEQWVLREGVRHAQKHIETT